MSLSIMYDSGRNNARSSVYREAKMMSYTFAEMIDEDAATAAPRCYPHSILGKGKRGAQSHRHPSSQEELMRAVRIYLLP